MYWKRLESFNLLYAKFLVVIVCNCECGINILSFCYILQNVQIDQVGKVKHGIVVYQRQIVPRQYSVRGKKTKKWMSETKWVLIFRVFCSQRGERIQPQKRPCCEHRQPISWQVTLIMESNSKWNSKRAIPKMCSCTHSILRAVNPTKLKSVESLSWHDDKSLESAVH